MSSFHIGCESKGIGVIEDASKDWIYNLVLKGHGQNFQGEKLFPEGLELQGLKIGIKKAPLSSRWKWSTWCDSNIFIYMWSGYRFNPISDRF